MKCMREFLKRHSFVIGLFLFSFFLRLLVVLCIHTDIVSDFGLMYKAGFISSYQDARKKITKLDRSTIVALLLKEYIK